MTGETAMEAEFGLHLERRLPAATDLVYRMHTDPELLAQWWGPKGFSVPSIDSVCTSVVSIESRCSHRRVTSSSSLASSVMSNLMRGWPTRFGGNPPTRTIAKRLWCCRSVDLGKASSLTIDQGVFATVERRALHEQGWTESIDRLEELVQSRE